MSTFFGIVVGIAGLALGWVGVGVTWCFSRKASKELRSEAARLRHLTDAILRVLEDDGRVEVRRDAEGNVTGLGWKRGQADTALAGDVQAAEVHSPPR